MARQYYQGLVVQPSCHRCPLQHDKKVLPDGFVPAKLCFVGEGPGRMEVQEGRGFVGPSGKLLWYLAQQYGVSRDEVWVSNAALCLPRAVRFATGATMEEPAVKAASVKACRRRLIGELLAVTEGNDSAVILPLGNLALQSLSLRKGARVYAYRGSVMHIDLKELWNQVAAT